MVDAGAGAQVPPAPWTLRGRSIPHLVDWQLHNIDPDMALVLLAAGAEWLPEGAESRASLVCRLSGALWHEEDLVSVASLNVVPRCGRRLACPCRVRIHTPPGWRCLGVWYKGTAVTLLETTQQHTCTSCYQQPLVSSVMWTCGVPHVAKVS